MTLLGPLKRRARGLWRQARHWQQACDAAPKLLVLLYHLQMKQQLLMHYLLFQRILHGYLCQKN